MKKISIALKPFNNKIFYKDNIFRINSGDNIFFNFDKRLKKRGVTIHTVDLANHHKIDKYVYCDLPYPWDIKNWLIVILNRKKNILLTFESPAVNPFSTMKFFYFLFPKVYTWKDSLVDNKKIHKLHIPQLDVKESEKNLNTKVKNKKFITFINSNKKVPLIFEWLGRSKVLYEERIRAIKYFSEKIPTDFDFYGRGWNKDLYRAYKGSVDNKNDILSKYKFCICYENCVANGYITEKIFDCFKAGTIPVYWGAPNIADYIPKDTFIDMRNFNSYSKLFQYLKKLTPIQRQQFVINGKEFLKKNKIWYEDSFENLFIKAVSK